MSYRRQSLKARECQTLVAIAACLGCEATGAPEQAPAEPAALAVASIAIVWENVEHPIFCSEDFRHETYCGDTDDPEQLDNVAAAGSSIRIAFTAPLPEAAGAPDSLSRGYVDWSCDGNDVDYDSSYDSEVAPFSIPPSPALVLAPGHLPGGSTCEIMLNEQLMVAAAISPDQVGSRSFGIAPLALVDTTPKNGSADVALARPLTLVFNNAIDLGSAVEAIRVTRDQQAEPVDVRVHAPRPEQLLISPPYGVWEPTTRYEVAVSVGLLDAAGGHMFNGASFFYVTGEGQ